LHYLPWAPEETAHVTNLRMNKTIEVEEGAQNPANYLDSGF
jgi:hypothetical protein